MTNKSMLVLNLLVLYISSVNGEATCKPQLVQEWHPQPASYIINWTLRENICVDFYEDCWGLDMNTKTNMLDNKVVPQICPLQIQSGDILVISTEPSLLELNLMNVSEASFINCQQNITNEDQLLFSCKLKGMYTVNSRWLDIGTHYFISVVTSGPSLCQMGLRLNVTVKQQFCQESLDLEFCSGHGKCLSEIWSKSYSCHCQPPYSGKYCEKLDACCCKPCKINENCNDTRGTLTKQGCECICHLTFTGRNRSEIIGQCQPHICFHGNCTNITEMSFICEYDEQISGPYNAESIKHCDSQSCLKGEICQNGTSVYFFEYPEGFLNQNCEPDITECSSVTCWTDINCLNITSDLMCICSPMLTGKSCKLIQMSHKIFTGKNNFNWTTSEEACHYSCMPGITGKNDDKEVDPYRLVSINCLNEEWNFHMIGQFRYMCLLWCTKNASSCVKNIYIIHQPCNFCGVTWYDIRQAQVPPHIACVWQLKLAVHEVDKCELAIVAYLSLTKSSTEEAVDVKTPESISHLYCFPYKGTVQIYANGFNYSTEEESQRSWCMCVLGGAVRLHVENVTDCQENQFQHEDTSKGQMNILRCGCAFVCLERFCTVNVENCLGNQSTSEHALGPDHLCNCNCLPRCESSISGTESYTSAPCKNGTTRTCQSGCFFCKGVQRFTGSHCEFGPCEPANPCENGAECREKMDLEAFPFGFQCQCGKGFAGARCEFNVNECSSSPCLNGYCYDMAGGFSCLCSPGYAGMRCEQDIDDCLLNACEHNATCQDLHLGYQCVCPSGWEGHFCEQESSLCKINPCENNSTCTDLYNNYHCDCTSGWTGKNCSEEINECDSDPCMNGGLCHESAIPGQFICLCPPFYMGRFCHEHYSPCDPLNDPCRNNSTCLTLVDGNHYCICKEGFVGDYCETDVNECLSNPCLNEGHCKDGVNDFRCDCRPGFSGHLCETEINECSSRPCKNNGTCVDLENRFLCNCQPGYHGSLCELIGNERKTPFCLDTKNCVSKTDDHKCLCAPGYTGSDCEVNIDECLSEPCLHNGDCVDGVNRYTCDCQSGFFGTHCETNANDCFSNPCLHGRCIDLVNAYQCLCEAEWTSTRCEVKITDRTSIPCVNGGFSQKTVHGLTCICPLGYTGEYCEQSIRHEMNLALCLNGGILIAGPEHTFECRCLPGFSGPFCETDVDECSSSPCLNGANCEDYINGYSCICQEGWCGHHCDKKLHECFHTSCTHGVCKGEAGSPYFYAAKFVTSSTGLLYGDEKSGVTCLPPISPRTDVVFTLRDIIHPSETSANSFPSIRPTGIWTMFDTYPVHQAVSSSPFLNFGVHDEARIVQSEASGSQRPIPTSAATAAFVFPGRGSRTSIVSSLMTDFIFPTQSFLLEKHLTTAFSAITMNSVISDIPGADTALNRYSLLSRGSPLTTPATSAPPVVSWGAQEAIEKYSAVSLISRIQHWRLLSSSKSAILPGTIITSKQVAILNSSTLHRFSSQANEHLRITEASSDQRLTNIKSQAADSLSELRQTCATCSMTETKSSYEFSDQVLHRKQSQFYETFWMNSAILASWYTHMGTQTITSGHSFSSPIEITPSMALTELSFLFPSKKSAKRTALSASIEEVITLSGNLDVNLCSYKTCLSIVPSQTVSSDFMSSDLTSKLITYDLSVSKHILKLLETRQCAGATGLTEIVNENNSLDVEEGRLSRELFKHHTTDSSSDFELNLQTNSDVTLKINSESVYLKDLKTDLLVHAELVSDTAHVFSDVVFYATSATQSLPAQTSLPMSVIQLNRPSSVDYPTFTSDLTEESKTSAEWSRWELQPSMHNQPSLVAYQSLPQTRSLTLPSLESITAAPQLIVSDFSCVWYYGDSYLKFQNVFLNQQNNISLEFQTLKSSGLLLYIKQDSDSVDAFFTQLYIENGTLKYLFRCAGELKLKSINTTFRVDIGQKYTLHIRQNLDPCKAELTILEKIIKLNESINHFSGTPLPVSGSAFIGGSTRIYGKDQIFGPVLVENFTGYIEVTEFNNLGSFIPSMAVEKYHIDNCRSQDSVLSPATSFTVPSGIMQGNDSEWTSLGPSPAVTSVCQEKTCHNGGTCRPILLSSGGPSFQCDCPLRFTGHFCEKDAGLFFPYFNGNSYLELPLFAILDKLKSVLGKERNRIVTIHLTIKTSTSNGTILYSTESNFGKLFLHLFLVEGRPTVQYGCGSSQNILTISANYTINKNTFIPIMIRYTVPIGNPCMIELAADGKLPIQKKKMKTAYAQGYFESMFLGNIPGNVEVPQSVGHIYGFKGCIRELRVNNKEIFIISEARHWKNIESCYIPWCNHLCRNNGTCISDGENWFCECPRLYSGKLCQFSSCENNACGNGATCVPKSGTDFVCLCPYGKSGPLCTDAINITQPRFSGTDTLGYTSFLAYSRISDISFNYEFRLKFQLANNHSALQNNLMFFTGQKGHGLDGDDFLAVGLLDGCVVYNYNLGSGLASVKSEPLDLNLEIHTVYLGRSFRKGWLKVDDHKNKSIISPGRLVGLNVFSEFYVGGYSEYLPDLLPNGASFKNGFQGCIFTLQVRTEKDSHFRGLGNPEGHPSAGRTVDQCDASPCHVMKCGNGGTCIEDGATAYCKCTAGWKGTFCMDAVSTCDPEHDPPHHCSKGATCVSLPHGYTCYCPLGTTGIYCEQAFSISDPSFRSDKLSWMSFASFHIRKTTHIQLQFQPLATDGILFYVAQHLKAQSGDFLCLSLVKGSLQLRYNLGDRTIILETPQNVTANGSIWHVVKAGRVGAEGYLDLNGIIVRQTALATMDSLDTNTDFYIGGVPSLNLVNPMATANEPVGFRGCVREVIINNQELQLTELGAKDGSNVGDCDGTACGYNICRNGGECMVNGTTFSCRCLPQWTGNTCSQSKHCLNNTCLHQSLCIPNKSSYNCLCALGWVGRYCENRTSFSTAKFMGNSYIKYSDPNYKERSLQFTTVSLNFSSTETEGLIVWMGKAQNEENDFLAIGIHNQTLKIAVNLGGKISVSVSDSNITLCCNKWHHVVVSQNRTLIKAYLDNNLIFLKDIDPQKMFVALNYDGICYLGGFEYGRQVNIVTQEIFKKDFVGKIKDVVFFQDSKKTELIKSEGYNVYDGDENN